MSRGSRALTARYSPRTSSAQRPSATNPTPWPSACPPVSVRPAPVAAVRRALPPRADRRSLSESQTTEAFGVVMRGEATPAQIAALLMGLRVKGETPEEVAGAARALREAMVRVEANGAHLVDTCGTGGGAVSTFNISTAPAPAAT